MKTIFTIKWLSIAIFVLNLQSAIIHPQSHNLYAQDPQLFEHTWYLNNIVIENASQNSPSPENEIELYFLNELIEVAIPFCKDGHGGFVDYNEGNSFNLINFDWVLIGSCNSAFYPEFFDFISNHYNFFIDVNIGPRNPFTYTLEPIDNYIQLTITNGEGDWAVYNSVLLSTPTFHQNSITMYPNPVEENLTINNMFNQRVTATIYDINGKTVQGQTLEANTTTINVKALNTGFYFVVFENQSGARVSKKFVKR